MDKVISATDTLNKQNTEEKHLFSKLDLFNCSVFNTNFLQALIFQR